MRKMLKYWFLRFIMGKNAVKIKIPFNPFPELGDIISSGVGDLEYVGKGKYLPVKKDASITIQRGVRIKNHLIRGSKNQFVIRNGKVIAERKNKK